jgi:hypothetical protein
VPVTPMRRRTPSDQCSLKKVTTKPDTQWRQDAACRHPLQIMTSVDVPVRRIGLSGKYGAGLQTFSTLQFEQNKNISPLKENHHSRKQERHGWELRLTARKGDFCVDDKSMIPCALIRSGGAHGNDSGRGAAEVTAGRSAQAFLADRGWSAVLAGGLPSGGKCCCF